MMQHSTKILHHHTNTHTHTHFHNITPEIDTHAKPQHDNTTSKHTPIKEKHKERREKKNTVQPHKHTEVDSHTHTQTLTKPQ